MPLSKTFAFLMSIYKDHFNPSNSHENILLGDSGTCKPSQFRITIALENSITYILVVSAYGDDPIDEFSIFSSGPNNVDLKNIISAAAVEHPFSSTGVIISQSICNINPSLVNDVILAR
ncbi:unnamed protein product [Adineta steineri]|uniref:Uncharacterized protein n=1 Tax=Adineta steineri TaxID=433720 RepID=A0A815IRG4_9BILA|nr:unnamed protein product [Adineta steineri]CAF3695356.1 unnamed protein product [Adineta steineri]